MLSGSLDTFTIEAIFRLIESTGQTGQLTVDGSARASFVFDAGKVHFAGRTDGPGLADRLQSSGAISQGAWDRAASGPLAVWDALVEEGAALDVLAAMLREEIEDVTEPVLGKRTGTFEFVASATSSYGSVGFSVDEVLDGASSRRQRWEALAENVRKGDAIPSLTSQLPTEVGAVTLARSDWSVVSRCDGQRSVVDIAAALGRTHLVVAEAIAGLTECGVVEVDDITDVPAPATVEVPSSVSTVVESSTDQDDSDAKTPTSEKVIEESDERRPILATLDGGTEEVASSTSHELVGAAAGGSAPLDRHAAITMISALSRS